MFRTIIVFIMLPFVSLAQIPDPKPNTYINDYTNHLTRSEIQSLNESLQLLEQRTNVQVSVVLINELPANMEIEEFAQALGSKWKVGNAQNGLVYVAVLNKRRQRLDVASHLEGDMPDMIAKEIVDNLVPYLQKEDYFSALQELISQLDRYLGPETPPSTDTSDYVASTEFVDTAGPTSEALERKKFEKEKAKYDRLEPYAFGGILAFAAFFVIWAYRNRKKYVREHTINGVYLGVGSDYYTNTQPSESSDSSDSSDFRGFGGSDGDGFSGGGAGGSW
jgi:uncharacterized protein